MKQVIQGLLYPIENSVTKLIDGKYGELDLPKIILRTEPDPAAPTQTEQS
jgi:hypothetical protein